MKELKLEPKSQWRLGWGPEAVEGVDQYIIRTPCSASRGGRSSKASLTCCTKEGEWVLKKQNNRCPLHLYRKISVMSHSSPWWVPFQIPIIGILTLPSCPYWPTAQYWLHTSTHYLIFHQGDWPLYQVCGAHIASQVCAVAGCAVCHWTMKSGYFLVIS